MQLSIMIGRLQGWTNVYIKGEVRHFSLHKNANKYVYQLSISGNAGEALTNIHGPFACCKQKKKKNQSIEDFCSV